MTQLSTATRAWLTLALVAPLALAGCRDNDSAGESRQAAAQAEAHDAAGLLAVLDAADAAIEGDDMDALYRLSTPEPMMEAILTSQGLTTPEEKAMAREMMEAMMKTSFEQIDITSHEVDRGAIRYVETDSGATIAYIPMEMSMTAPGMTLTTSGNYVGLEREGEWFLLNPSDAGTIDVMKAAFPELEGQDIQPNAMTTL